MNCILCNTPFPSNTARCPHCGKWHTGGESTQPVYRLSDIDVTDVERLITGPWDIVWGGGIETTSVTLLGGGPGAGKSTLMLQLAQGVPGTLYVSAEENLAQIKGRVDRLRIPKEALESIYIAPAFGSFDLEGCIKRVNPNLIIIDSLSGLIGDNLREMVDTVRLLKMHATRFECPVILINHINKEEEFAGFIKIEHMVDTTISLFVHQKPEGEIRMLKAKKNRHGPTGPDATMAYEMTQLGLVQIVKRR